MTRRIGVIGAGPGGLAAAMLLARAGADVTLFERHGRVGGRSAAIVADAAPGRFRFDMGPTFFLYPRILEEVFEACGRRLRDEVEMIRLDPQYHLVFETGGRIAATANLDRLEAEVARIAPEDARHVARYMEDNRRKFAACRPVLERPFNSIRDMLRTDLLGALPVLVPPRSVDKRPEPLLRRSARAARVLVPEQIPGHVAVPLPEPVHDPGVHGIRIRRLASARRDAAQ